MGNQGKREIVGYAVGFTLFVVVVPVIMWLASGAVHFSFVRVIACAILALTGLGLSVWSIAYMKLVGKGNPLDAFNHQMASRTSVLMTEGPYAICRNPMLLGVLLYYVGVVILLGSAGALAVFVAYALIMVVQVSREEQRLEQDFGDDYRAYKKTTKRLIPFVW